MRVWQRYVLGLLLIPLAIGLAGSVQAASMHGRASTVVEWYDNAQEETALPVHQYLQFSLMDLGDQGYNFKIYGRLSDDLNNKVDVKSRLYYAFLEKRNLYEGLDFRLGRQFISTTAGASLMDGLMLQKKLSDKYRIKLFGGGDVTYYEGYNVKDVVWGAELGGDFFSDKLILNLSYLQKLESGRLDEELLGFDANLEVNDQLTLYSETQYNWLNEQISHQLIGGKYRFEKPFTLRLEYLYSLPVFSASSIYSVFAVDEYEEFTAEATWVLSRELKAFARYTKEFYVDFDDADVLEVGLEKLLRDKFSGYLTGVVRNDDDGQSLYGVKARGGYRFTATLEAGAGAEIDVLEREIAYFHTDDSDQDETTNTRLWLFCNYEINDKINLQGKVERIESDLWDYYYRGRLRLNIIF